MKNFQLLLRSEYYSNIFHTIHLLNFRRGFYFLVHFKILGLLKIDIAVGGIYVVINEPGWHLLRTCVDMEDDATHWSIFCSCVLTYIEWNCLCMWLWRPKDESGIFLCWSSSYLWDRVSQIVYCLLFQWPEIPSDMAVLKNLKHSAGITDMSNHNPSFCEFVGEQNMS